MYTVAETFHGYTPYPLVKTLRRRVFRQSLSSPFPKEAYISYGYGYAFFLSFSPLFPFFSSFIYFFFAIATVVKHFKINKASRTDTKSM